MWRWRDMEASSRPWKVRRIHLDQPYKSALEINCVHGGQLAELPDNGLGIANAGLILAAVNTYDEGRALVEAVRALVNQLPRNGDWQPGEIKVALALAKYDHRARDLRKAVEA